MVWEDVDSANGAIFPTVEVVAAESAEAAVEAAAVQYEPRDGWNEWRIENAGGGCYRVHGPAISVSVKEIEETGAIDTGP